MWIMHKKHVLILHYINSINSIKKCSNYKYKLYDFFKYNFDWCNKLLIVAATMLLIISMHMIALNIQYFELIQHKF